MKERLLMQRLTLKKQQLKQLLMRLEEKLNLLTSRFSNLLDKKLNLLSRERRKSKQQHKLRLMLKKLRESKGRKRLKLQE